jgi:hypothetical protein
MQDAHDSMTVAKADTVRLQVLYGLCRQALNHARAAWAVIDAGLTLEAGVNIRAALEHAVTAQWAYFTPDGVSRLVASAKKKAAAYFETAGLQVSLGEEAVQKLACWKNSGKGIPDFARICDEIDGTHDPKSPKSGTLRFEYVRLSQAVHVTSSTITDYLQVDALYGELSLSAQSPDRFYKASVWDLGAATAMASWLLERLRVAPNSCAEVERIADAAMLPSTLAEDYQIAKGKSRSNRPVDG